MAKGIRKIDEIAGPDGTLHPIRCDLATGKFSIVFADASGVTVHRIDGKDLEKVREEAVAWLKETSTLKWEPVILMRCGYNRSSWQTYVGSEKSIDLEYTRYFRAARKNGEAIWKEFAKSPSPSYPDIFNEADDDDVEGVPGKDCRAGWISESKVIPYTPARWSSLRTISVMIKTLNERIHGLVEGDKMEALLESIAAKGAPALLFAPGENKATKEKAHA